LDEIIERQSESLQLPRLKSHGELLGQPTKIRYLRNTRRSQ
jgi:hypothetical protein